MQSSFGPVAPFYADVRAPTADGMRFHQAGTEVELVGLGKEEYNGMKATCEAPHSVDRRVVSLADGTKITVKPTNMKGFEDFGKILIIAGSHGGVAG